MIISKADRLSRVSEYYFSKKLREVGELKSQGRPVLNIGIGSPDLPPSQATISSLQYEAEQSQNHAYQSYKGIPELRAAMAGWYQSTYNVSLNPEREVLPLIGSKEGITHISLAFLNAGDQVLIPELAYPAYQAVSEMVGAETVKFPMLPGSWHPDFDALEQMDLSKVKIMWVNYPNMPTGAPASRELFERLVEFGRKHCILICHDNPYSLILNDEKPLSILETEGAREVALELNSMSKSHNMAGWRIGWVNGAQDYIDAILKIKSNVDSGMFYPLQKAAATAFQNPKEWHEAQNRIYRERKQIVHAILKKMECTFDERQTGLFVWARVSEQIEEVENLIDHLLYEYNVFLSPGFIFGEKGKRYIRISLCSTKKDLETVLQRLQNFNLKEINKAA
ncbi:MAG: aminotransferase class I/II-fold pyridoxal phosphate-dependent enzyme [Cytophagales bacterium]|nr:aminotransferase class I/II-fold pyridoxal phosphate-dependent enzyme [Cytophagales bacterium]